MALGEKWQGSGKDSSNYICLTIGTGIGGGIIIDNKLYCGSRFSAGEFGFMMVGNPFKDEINPCLSYRGGIFGGIRKEYSKLIGCNLDEVDVKEIFKEKDDICKRLVDNFYGSLAQGIYNLYFMFNPEKILLGGAISSREDLLDKIYEKLQIVVDRMGDIRGTDVKELIKLQKCKLGNEAGQLGALYNFKLRKEEE